MKVQNFPDIDMPMVSVVVALPGATPGQLENEVARKIENSLATVQGVKHISTTIVDGSVSIMVEFRLEKDLQEALDDVRSAVSRVRGDLPSDLREPIVAKLDLAAQPMLAYALSSKRMGDADLSWFVDNDVSKRLLAIPGVGAVNRVGGADRQVQVALDPARLQGLGITPDKEVITHCQTHRRSGFSYVVAKALGYPRVKAYAGSWSEWGNLPDTPIER